MRRRHLYGESKLTQNLSLISSSAVAGGETEPGSLGQMDGGEDTGPGSYGTSFEDEPPLLQELGIDFQLIKQKVCQSLKISFGCSSLFLQIISCRRYQY